MVSERAVGRPRDGSSRKDRSHSAVRSYVASRLVGRSDQDFLTKDLGVALNTSAVNRAAGPFHWRPPGYKPRGRAAGGPMPPSGTAIRGWLAVRPGELGLGVGLVTFAAAGAQAQRELYRTLQAVIGVAHLLAVGDGPDRRVIALVLTDGEQDRRRLRAQLDEFADSWHWDEVDDETVEPAIETWRYLARSAARREDLLLS
jgi:hypothetical protein